MAARREKMMRSCQLRSFGLEHCYFAEVSAPTAGPGEVVVAVRALSLSHRDLAIAKGLHNQNLRLPRTVGNEVAGEVIQVGDGVIGLSVGDRVVNNPIPEWVEGEWRNEYLPSAMCADLPGLDAEQVRLPGSGVTRIPSSMSFAAASTLVSAGVSAWNALTSTARVQPGHVVLTLGTGGVSMFVLLLGKALGCRVIITSKDDAKLEIARTLGADHTINYCLHPCWEKAVLAFTSA